MCLQVRVLCSTFLLVNVIFKILSCLKLYYYKLGKICIECFHIYIENFVPMYDNSESSRTKIRKINWYLNSGVYTRQLSNKRGKAMLL